jgi:hypothetical protein
MAFEAQCQPSLRGLPSYMSAVRSRRGVRCGQGSARVEQSAPSSRCAFVRATTSALTASMTPPDRPDVSEVDGSGQPDRARPGVSESVAAPGQAAVADETAERFLRLLAKDRQRTAVQCLPTAAVSRATVIDRDAPALSSRGTRRLARRRRDDRVERSDPVGIAGRTTGGIVRLIVACHGAGLIQPGRYRIAHDGGNDLIGCRRDAGTWRLRAASRRPSRQVLSYGLERIAHQE